jgi:hypothetical protein
MDRFSEIASQDGDAASTGYYYYHEGVAGRHRRRRDQFGADSVVDDESVLAAETASIANSVNGDFDGQSLLTDIRSDDEDNDEELDEDEVDDNGSQINGATSRRKRHGTGIECHMHACVHIYMYIYI